MILVLDNHDSFTFNLVQALAARGAEVVVHESDAISLNAIAQLAPDGVLISPGPGRPCDAGISRDAVHAFGASVPMLGVCLGHQVMCEALGAKVVHASRLVHGRASAVHHDGKGLFHGIANPFAAARYHSLIVDGATLPASLDACAHTEAGELMAVRHRTWPMSGVQFHPESFLTQEGPRLLENFLALVQTWHEERRTQTRRAAHG